MLPSWYWALWAAVAGACAGGFLNVAAWRLPRGISLLIPSACPGCQSRIAWYDKLPILSFVLLRGRCRACRMSISWRYPAGEAITAVVWALVAWRYGLSSAAAAAAIFASGLLLLAMIDLDTFQIPDAVSLPLMAAGLCTSLLGVGPRPADALLSGAGAAGLFALIAWLSRGGMGFGDAILAGILGVHLGVWRTALALWVGTVLGGLIAVVLLLAGRVRRGQPIPYGPFLAAGGLAAILWL
jgi:leader peptidase (prepilin peptidase)/N-methyltransferase